MLVFGGLGFAMLGFFPTTANVTPGHMERRLAMGAVDASMERHAPRITNPLTPTDQNLEDGMKLYTMNCALCHGGLDRKALDTGHFVLSASAKSDLRPSRRS